MIAPAYAAEAQGLPQFDTTHLTSQALWTVVSFLVLLFLLKQFVLPLIQRILDERADLIRHDLETASRVREESERLLARYEAQLRGLHDEAEQFARQAERRAAEYQQQAIHRIDESLRHKKQVLEEEIDFARQAAIRDIRQMSVDAALLTAEKLMRRALDETDAARLVDESIAELKQEKQRH